jgi:hypothetical protein
MPTWNVIVQSFRRNGSEAQRFMVILFDAQGPRVRGPDGGKYNTGYTEAELRLHLSENYQLSGGAIDSLVEHSKRVAVTASLA